MRRKSKFEGSLEDKNLRSYKAFLQYRYYDLSKFTFHLKFVKKYGSIYVSKKLLRVFYMTLLVHLCWFSFLTYTKCLRDQKDNKLVIVKINSHVFHSRVLFRYKDYQFKVKLNSLGFKPYHFRPEANVKFIVAKVELTMLLFISEVPFS